MSDAVLTGLIYISAGISMLILIGIMGYVFARGIPNVTWSFLTTVTSTRKGTFGILGNIVNTIVYCGVNPFNCYAAWSWFCNLLK